MSSRWAEAWWPHFARDAEPFVFVVRDGDEIVGLAPLVLRHRGGFRILEPAGMEPGDYWDVLAAPEHREAVAAAFAHALREHAGEWDAWILRCLPADSPVEAALDAAGLRSLLRPRIQSPAIALPGSFDEYLASLSGSHRQNLRRHLRRLDDGEVTLRELTDPGELPDAIERWSRLRARQWQAAGRPINPQHLTARFAGFLGDATKGMLPVGLAQFWEFERDGQVVGSYVNFADRRDYHWYLGGFDPDHHSLGLGKIAIGHGIRTSIAAGRRRYDFGRGAEPYKYWYGATDDLLAARVVGHGRTRSRAALAAARLMLRRR
jgi:CelD/BcsL family acetyltransferase involved in cellulose biosynthesis